MQISGLKGTFKFSLPSGDWILSIAFLSGGSSLLVRPLWMNLKFLQDSRFHLWKMLFLKSSSLKWMVAPVSISFSTNAMSLALILTKSNPSFAWHTEIIVCKLVILSSVVYPLGWPFQLFQLFLFLSWAELFNLVFIIFSFIEPL